MDIDNMGEKVVEQLMQKGFVQKPSDIFRLTEEQLFQLEGFKEKSVQNLMQSIDKSRHVTLAKFIMALGIKHVGEETAALLAAKAGSLEGLMAMSQEALRSIGGIGDVVAGSIVEYFQDAANRQEIDDLLALGVVPRQQEVVTFTGHPFEGKQFVLTGTLEKFTRTSAAGLIKERGGKVTDSVTKKTDFLVAGDQQGLSSIKRKPLGFGFSMRTPL